MTTSRISALLAALAIVGTGTAVSIGAATADRGATRASATIVDPAGATIGFATFTEDATGRLHVNVKVSGLSQGEHGIHIHGVGACTPTFAAAGSHHNPLGALHGAHAGDLPNLIVNVAGNGRLNGKTDHASLSAGPVSVFDVDGAAIVIHADPDDFVSQPTGNSGGRIACGVIVAD